MTEKTNDPALSHATNAVLLVGVVLSVVGGLVGGMGIGASAAVGAAIAYANLIVLSRSVSRLLSGGGGSWAALFLLKFTVLLALTYVLIDRQLVLPIGLAVGFGALPIGVMIGGLLSGGRFDNQGGNGNSPVAQVPQMEADPREPVATRD